MVTGDQQLQLFNVIQQLCIPVVAGNLKIVILKMHFLQFWCEGFDKVMVLGSQMCIYQEYKQSLSCMLN